MQENPAALYGDQHSAYYGADGGMLDGDRYPPATTVTSRCTLTLTVPSAPPTCSTLRA